MLRGNPKWGGGLFIAWVAGSLQKHPRFLSRARGVYVFDRRGSAVSPIRVKLELRDQRVEPVAFTSRWNRSENTFRRAIKITRLIIKRGFCSVGYGWSRAVSATVIGRNPVSQRSSVRWQGSVSGRYEIRGGK